MGVRELRYLGRSRTRWALQWKAQAARRQHDGTGVGKLGIGNDKGIRGM